MPHIHFAIAPQLTQPVKGIIFNISYHIPHSFDYTLQFTTLIAITSHNNEGSQMSRQPRHTQKKRRKRRALRKQSICVMRIRPTQFNQMQRYKNITMNYNF